MRLAADSKLMLAGAVVGLALLVLVVVRLKAAAADPAGTGKAIGRGVIDFAGGAVEGIGAAAGEAVAESAKRVGEAVGIPRTDATECERALAEGRTWDASFACPAGDFLRGVFGSKSQSRPGASGGW